MNEDKTNTGEWSLETKEEVLEYIKICGCTLSDPEFDQWRNDRDVVLLAVQRDWCNYVHTNLSEALLNDKEIFLAAHWQDVRAYSWAGCEIRELVSRSGCDCAEEADAPIEAALKLDKLGIAYKAGDDLNAMLKKAKLAQRLTKNLSKERTNTGRLKL